MHEMLEHQMPVLEDPHRFKVLACGRRWGKDRFSLHAGILGHGPEARDGRAFPGVLDGWDVVWVTRDYPQGEIIWAEEVLPRFKGRPHVRVNENEKSVTFGDIGTLWVRSAENVDSIRGIGKRLKGVVINEAAHFDLRSAWLRVIRPMLVDNAGWAIIMSTTNSGHDGNPEKLTPSWFNRLCEEIRRGSKKRPADKWAFFAGTAFDNPALDPGEVQELIDEYPSDSAELQEEVYAKLLEGRHGVAFPMWRDDLHVLGMFRVPTYWRWAAGLDWGYRNPGCFVLFACSADGDAIAVDELYFNDGPPETKLHAYEAGHHVGLLCRQYPMAEYIAADEQMWYETGSSGQTIAEEFREGLMAAYGGGLAPVLIEAAHGPHSRAPKFQLMSRMLAWKALKKGERGYAELAKQKGVLRMSEGLVPPWHRPRLRFTDLCEACIRTIPKLVYNPKAKKEDVDTTQEDHAYDAVTMFLTSRVPRAERPESGPGVDRHPGFTKGGRKRPDRMPSIEGPEKPWGVGRFRVPREAELEPLEE